jgi:hypothetical protein
MPRAIQRGPSGAVSSPGAEYPHLTHALQALPEDARRIWGDAGDRRRALEDLLSAWEAGSAEERALLHRVDDAIASGLKALDLPRGRLNGLRIEEGRPHFVGAKLPACVLVLSAEGMREWIRGRREPDVVFRTWIHESLHARLPIDPRAMSEHRQTEGYEEGLVEGLSRIITLERASLRLTADLPYTYYVQGYATLARAINVGAEQLWRELWRYPMGGVRAAFVDVIDHLRQGSTGAPMAEAQRLRLLGVADAVFSSTRRGWMPNAAAMSRAWGAALSHTREGAR